MVSLLLLQACSARCVLGQRDASGHGYIKVSGVGVWRGSTGGRFVGGNFSYETLLRVDRESPAISLPLCGVCGVSAVSMTGIFAAVLLGGMKLAKVC